MGIMNGKLIAGNRFDKYRSPNPLHRYLVAGFVQRAGELLALPQPKRILEVGAGPGDLAFALLRSAPQAATRGTQYLGTDVSAQQVRIARQRYPHLRFQCASVYDLPFDDGRFDLCIACEVFEHLEDPAAALAEVARVAKYLLLSVPWEPAWRLLNVLRGCYVRDLGNTPGHVQHFTRTAIKRLVRTKFQLLAERRPFPWTMLLARQVEAP